MNPDLQAQTDAFVQHLNQLHTDLYDLNLTAMIASTVIIALLIVIAFRKR